MSAVSSPGRWAVLVVWAASPVWGCNYDLTRLRSSDAGHDVAAATDAPRDAGVDARGDTGVDVSVESDGVALADVLVRPPMTGDCVSHEWVDLATAGTTLGNTVVIDGNTMDGHQALTPVALGPGCPGTYTTDGPERVYKYTVRTGPRLVASTNGTECTSFDTVLFALTSCDRGVNGATELACDDDDNVVGCSACGDGGTGATCAGLASSLSLEGLVPGDVVYLVVAGIAGASGPFRLSVAENAGDVVAPPDGGAAHCGCPTLPLTDAGVLPQPTGFPGGPGDVGTLAGATPGAITGARAVHLSTVSSVTASFRIAAQGTAPAGCEAGRTVVDLYVQDTPMASFAVPRSVDPGTLFNVMYTSVGTLAVLNQTIVPFAYRVRGFDPSTCSGGYAIDSTAGTANAIVLYPPGP